MLKQCFCLLGRWYFFEACSNQKNRLFYHSRSGGSYERPASILDVRSHTMPTTSENMPLKSSFRHWAPNRPTPLFGWGGMMSHMSFIVCIVRNQRCHTCQCVFTSVWPLAIKQPRFPTNGDVVCWRRYETAYVHVTIALGRITVIRLARWLLAPPPHAEAERTKLPSIGCNARARHLTQ